MNEEELEDVAEDNEEESFEGFETDEIDEEDDEEDEDLRTIAPKFDKDKSSIVVDAVGRVVNGNEEDAYRFWITKCLLTERYKYLGYDSDFGIEAEEIIRSDYDRDIAESELIRAITEGLEVDDRTQGVEDFEFEWSGDEVFIKFSVESIYGDVDLELTTGGDDDVGEVSFNST